MSSLVASCSVGDIDYRGKACAGSCPGGLACENGRCTSLTDAGAADAPVDTGTPPCSIADKGVNANFHGYRMFPASHPFNTRIDGLPVHSQSAAWLQNCSPLAPHLQMSIGIPYNIVGADTPPVTATSLALNSMPYPNPWPFPTGAAVENAGADAADADHHLLAFDAANCNLYEVFDITWGNPPSTFTAVSGTVWSADGAGNGAGADTAGLPILPGLVRYDELITDGAIEHALRFTCAQTQHAHIAPARSSSAASSNPAYPPMGMRVRLKASYDPTAQGFPQNIVVILQAIQKYGLILADVGGPQSAMFVTGVDDPQLDAALMGPAYLLKNVTIDDLEVVDSGPVVPD